MNGTITLFPIIICLILVGLVAVFSYFSIIEPNEDKLIKVKDKKWSFNFKLAVFISAALQLILACAAIGHEHSVDMGDFAAWSKMLAGDGTFSFYTSGGLTDYPPGYMYILLLIGLIQRIFNLGTVPFYILLKLPSIACTVLSGILVYNLAREKFKDGVSVAIASFVLFNPAYYLNSVLWGQVDTIYALVLATMLVKLYKKDFIPAYFLFALGILIKLQSLVLTPILAFAIIEEFFIKGEGEERDVKLILKNLAFGIGAIAAMFVLFIPFGIGATIKQYISTLSSYPYMTVNAFNLWDLLGLNWVGIDTLNGVWQALGINPKIAFASLIGMVLLAIIVAISAWAYFKSKERSKVFYISAFLYLSSYMFSTKMHERYAFPALIFLLLAYVASPKRKNMIAYLLNSAFSFFSCAWVLYIYQTDINKYAFCSEQRIFSFINIVIYALFVWAMMKTLGLKFKKRDHRVEIEPMELSEDGATLTKYDKKAIAWITGIYAVIALFALGGFNTPKTEYTITSKPINVTFDKEYEIEKLAVYLGPTNLYENQKLELQFKDADGNSIGDVHELQEGTVFYWNYYDIYTTAKSVDIWSSSDDIHIMTAVFLDKNQKPIIPSNASRYSALFDESKTYSESDTLFNSTYFDEIYHARTAYEFIHRYSVYEWTHPPLGKIFISIGILIFGMDPFGWRIAGTLFGIAMIPFVYMFVKRLFKKSWLAILGALLYTFDFMHFAQSRIATIDVYVTFFIILMYLFMYRFYDEGMFAEDKRATLRTLALSGTCFGLGVASKWTALYAGAGLALIWLITVLKGVFEYANEKAKAEGANEIILKEFAPRLRNIIITCVIFYIIVPLIIYFIAYIPFMLSSGGISLKTIIDNQSSMYTYHSKTVVESTHPYSSRWYQWMIMTRPILFYAHSYSDTVRGAISSFGNPLVWWGGLVALFYNVYLLIKKHNKTALFLLIGYLAEILPWIGVERTTFIYHYFPAVIFLVLMIANTFNDLFVSATDEQRGLVKFYCKRYVIVAIVLFALFYPVLSGLPTFVKYVDIFLKWLPGWVLI